MVNGMLKTLPQWTHSECVKSGKVLSMASDVLRHMQSHDTVAKFILSIFYVIIIINMMHIV